MHGTVNIKFTDSPCMYVLFRRLFCKFVHSKSGLFILIVFITLYDTYLMFQWPRGLRRRSAAAHLLRFWVRIPPGAGMFVFCECCELSGRVLCNELITRPEESY